MSRISPIELPKRVELALNSVTLAGFINVRKWTHVLVTTILYALVGFYAIWTAWMFALLPHPLSATSLLVQSFSLWFCVERADQLRILFGMMETQKPSRPRNRRMIPVTAILLIAGLPVILGILLHYVPGWINKGYLVDLDQDPRHKLVVALVHCFGVYRYDPTRGKAGEEKLLTLVREVDAALAFPGIGRLDAFTPEHEDLYARLLCWPADPPQLGELRELMVNIIGETLANHGVDR